MDKCINIKIGEMYVIDFEDSFTCEFLFCDKSRMDHDIDPYVDFVYHKDCVIILELFETPPYPKLKILTSKGKIGWTYFDYLFAKGKYNC
jgi:hypothetical protein